MVQLMWGPAPDSALPNVNAYSLAKINRSSQFKAGMVCDFTLPLDAQQHHQQRQRFQLRGGAEAIEAVADEDGFQIVDTATKERLGARKPGGGPGTKGKGKASILGRRNARNQVSYQEGILGQRQAAPRTLQPAAKKGKGKGKRRDVSADFVEWAVEPRKEWPVKGEITLANLAQVEVDADEVEFDDIQWAGTLRTYDAAYDRVTSRTAKPLAQFPHLAWYSPSATLDPVIQQIHQAHADVRVFSTDAVLAALMGCTRASYSFDIVCKKIDGKLLLDKRAGSLLDMYSVHETAFDPPSNEDPTSVDAPKSLMREAAMCGQSFSQQLLRRAAGSPVVSLAETHPFHNADDEEEPGSMAYRYRKVVIPASRTHIARGEEFQGDVSHVDKPMTVAFRADINGLLPGKEHGDDKAYCALRTLNEFDHKKQGQSWRTTLESQKGAVLAAGVRNNQSTMARWCLEATLAGAETIKLGFTSRNSVKDNRSHAVLGVQTHPTKNLMHQMDLKLDIAYGSLRVLVDEIFALPDGEFLLMKDPRESLMRIYDTMDADLLDANGLDSDDDESEDDDEADAGKL